jgi:hypothetical protein
MSIEITAALLVVLGVVAAVGFFVLKRALKWAVRLVLLFVAVMLMVAGAVAWLWHSYTAATPVPGGNRNAATRPANRGR